MDQWRFLLLSPKLMVISVRVQSLKSLSCCKNSYYGPQSPHRQCLWGQEKERGHSHRITLKRHLTTNNKCRVTEEHLDLLQKTSCSQLGCSSSFYPVFPLRSLKQLIGENVPVFSSMWRPELRYLLAPFLGSLCLKTDESDL